MSEMEYEVRGKGLFVIIKQVTHGFSYRDVVWPKRPKLNYDEDVNKILDTFNLDKNFYNYNLLYGSDLTNSGGEESFDDFITKVLNYSHKPSFLLLFLMSHGGEDGEFLLATKKENKASPLPECCGGDHSFDGICNGRKVVKDVIARVCECQKFKGIPKLFVLQTCRGVFHDPTHKDEADAPVPIPRSGPSSSELFIPSYSDLFVLRPTIEGNLSFVHKKDGSFLISDFCDAIAELKFEMKEMDSIVSQAYLKMCPKGRRHNRVRQCLAVDRYLGRQLSGEELLGGWLVNICQSTAAKVSKRPKYKQAPHLSSSLAYKLSVIKLLLTQDV